MYLSELRLDNYRGFRDNKSIRFNEGINVLIGANNSGKTSIIDALRLIFEEGKTKKMEIDDFNQYIELKNLKKSPPKIEISAVFKESENEKEYSNDLALIANWLIKINKPYEAQITYRYYLPEKEHKNYLFQLSNSKIETKEEYWRFLENLFLNKYKHKIYVGDIKNQNIIDYETLKKFDFQYLSAIRDVERDMFTGKNNILKEVINFYMDYDIKSNNELTDDDKAKQLKNKKKNFTKESKNLIEMLKSRMKKGEKHITKYIDSTGASFSNLKTTFDGKITEAELYSALKLIVQNDLGLKLPITKNGLGYNNLIYISLLLSKMQKDASGEYMGSNAKEFSILAIEEPEAHLHPNMQYKFLNFLKKNMEEKVNQVFITTHSPNITASLELEEIIVINKNKNEEVEIAYPGLIFHNEKNKEDASKKFIERFLDVTKADIFFADKIILVEGLSEQLLINEMAQFIGKKIIDEHISVINIGGRYFKHFLKLFDVKNETFAINKRVACITDLDPVKKSKKDNSRWKSCYPYEIENNPENFDYKEYSNLIIDQYPSDDSSNIKIFTQKKGRGITFEYQLILENPKNKKLVTESVSNASEIKNIMDKYGEGVTSEELVDLIKNETLKEKLIKSVLEWEAEEDGIKKNIIATRYLESIGKGEVAQELASVLYTLRKEGNIEMFNVPSYIKEAIRWICQKQKN